jgi:DNA-binding transcriptional ArsR family regulator
MTKISLELNDIKALASDSRLDILKILDGRKVNLQELTQKSNLNKATLHAHLTKLVEAGFIKKQGRQGHKWVYYTLTWKGESLLHPENARIVFLFCSAFFSFFVGIIQFVTFAKGKIVAIAQTSPGSSTTQIYAQSPPPLVNGTQQVGQIIWQRIADISAQNQTLYKMSSTLNRNATVVGASGNSFPDSAIQWSTTTESLQNIVPATQLPVGTNETTFYSPQASNVIAYVQDPTYLYFSLVCLAIFIVILCIGLWRLWKSRVPQL